MKDMNNEKKLFSEKAEKYLVCYNDECARAEQCLRRLLANYVPDKRRIVESVNPGYVKRNHGECDYFHSSEPTVLYKGMTHFYDEIPEQKAREIRFKLRHHFGESTYYRLRNGQRSITPAIYDQIRSICVACGWTEELVFDEETQEIKW